jgi:hypothetical protein
VVGVTRTFSGTASRKATPRTEQNATGGAAPHRPVPTRRADPDENDLTAQTRRPSTAENDLTAPTRRPSPDENDLTAQTRRPNAAESRRADFARAAAGQNS